MKQRDYQKQKKRKGACAANANSGATTAFRNGIPCARGQKKARDLRDVMSVVAGAGGARFEAQGVREWRWRRSAIAIAIPFSDLL